MSKYLWVAPELDYDEDRHSKIASVVLYCMQWTNFIDNRFAGNGPCCWKWAMSIMVGIVYLVELVVSDHSVKDQRITDY